MLLKSCVILLVVQSAITQNINGQTYRLPREVVPIRYNIEIRPNFDEDTFSGEVSIEVQCHYAVNTITLHENELVMPSKELIELKDMDTNNFVQIESVGFDITNDKHFFVITLTTVLREGGIYRLKIPYFRGTLNSPTKEGLYSASYTDNNGNQKKFATTRFKPLGARRVFPCFDEPALKARFIVTIKRPNSNYRSFSNMPKNESASCGLLDVYNETPLMSTYLLAFTIGQSNKLATDGQNTMIGPNMYLLNYWYAFNATDYILSQMKSYIGIPYALRHLYHIGIPDYDLAAEVIESWGIIQYRDNIVMSTASNTDLKTQRKILRLISRGIAHQWFGGLVTPQEWKYNWLSEGFSNYFEYYLADKVEPGMQMANRFVVESGRYAMTCEGFDLLSVSMNNPIENPNDINVAALNTLIGQKSGAVIRMLENVVSPSIFKQGLRYFVQEYQFQKVTPSDLYDEIQRAFAESNPQQQFSIRDFMQTWDSRSGLPLVTVTRNYGSNTELVHFKQRTFHNEDNRNHYSQWHIPINYAIESNHSFTTTTPQYWLTSSEANFSIPGLRRNEWLIVNNQQTGYYRVNYDLINWEMLSDVLYDDYTVIHPLNRAKLIDDCHFLSDSQYLLPTVCTYLEEYTIDEDDPIVRNVIDNRFITLDYRLYYTNTGHYFRRRVMHLLGGLYKRLTFDERPNDTLNDQENRASTLFLLCKVGHEECRLKALDKFVAWKNGRKNIGVNLEEAVHCGAMRNGRVNDFNYLFSIFTQSEDSQIKTTLLSGLSCIEEAGSLQRILQYLLDKKSFSLLEHAIKSISSSSKIGLETATDFIMERSWQIQKAFGTRTDVIIDELSTKIYSSEILKKLKRIEPRMFGGGIFNRVVNTVSSNVAWLQKNEENIRESLQRYVEISTIL